MVDRPRELEAFDRLLRRFPVVGIIGARQVGKTTLARAFAARTGKKVVYYDLENPEDLARLTDPMLVLKQHKGVVIIDEVQRMPDLFPVLRVLADRPGRPAQFLILGSASPAMLRQSSETLAGRIAYRRLNGFSLAEVGETSTCGYGYGEAFRVLIWRVRLKIAASGAMNSSAPFWKEISPAWDQHPLGGPAAILVHAGSLPWPNLECLRICAVLRCFGQYRAKLPGCIIRRVGRPPTAAMARKHQQATGKIPESLHHRLGYPAHAAQSAHPS